jgi:hypothetical protein
MPCVWTLCLQHRYAAHAQESAQLLEFSAATCVITSSGNTVLLWAKQMQLGKCVLCMSASSASAAAHM